MGAILKSAVSPSQPRPKPTDLFRHHVGTSFKDSMAFDLAVRDYYTIAYPTLSQERDLVAGTESSDDSKTTITSLVCRNAASGCKLSFVLAHSPDSPLGHPVARPILLSCHPIHSKRHCPLMKTHASALISSSPHRQFPKPAQTASESQVGKSATENPAADEMLLQTTKETRRPRKKKSAPPEPRLDGDALLAVLRDSSPDFSAASTFIPAGQSEETKDASSLDIDTDETMCDSGPVTKDEGKAAKDTAESSFASMKQAKEDRKSRRKTVALTTEDDRLAEDTGILSNAMMKQANKDKKSGRNKADTISVAGQATFAEALLSDALLGKEISTSELNIRASERKTSKQDHNQSKGEEKAVDRPKSARYKVEASTLKETSGKPFCESQGPSRRPKKQPKLEAIGDSRPIVADDRVAKCPSGPVSSKKHSSQMVDDPAVSSKAQIGQQAVQTASSKDARRATRKAARPAERSPSEGSVPSRVGKPHGLREVSPKDSASKQDASTPPAYLLPNEKEQMGWSELGLINDNVIKYVRQGLRDPNHLKARDEGSKELFDQLIPLAAGEPECRLAYNTEYRVPLLYSFFWDRDLDKHWKAG